MASRVPNPPSTPGRPNNMIVLGGTPADSGLAAGELTVVASA
jgi:hypothetical protein